MNPAPRAVTPLFSSTMSRSCYIDVLAAGRDGRARCTADTQAARSIQGGAALNPPIRILLVEDDRTLRELISTVLVDEGYEVVAVGDGRQGLEAARELLPSAILLDLNMPVLDGAGFVTAYHACAGPHAPIAVISASGRELAAERSLDLAGHLGKPFEFEDLLSLVARLVSHRAV